MTHAESQDLLLDLIYGELEPRVVEELQLHLVGCADCQREKAEIDRTRQVAAPLRESEEPTAGFDDRVMRAAKAQAQLEHDGNIGEVVDVSGSVKPAGVDVKDIDVSAPVKVRSVGRRRPRWMMPLTVGGSIAAAAALALVVGTTLTPKRTALPDDSAKYEIQVRGAAPKPESAPVVTPAAPPPAPQAAAERAPLQEPPPAPPQATPMRRRPRMEGSGGDAPSERRAAPAEVARAPSADVGGAAPSRNGNLAAGAAAEPGYRKEAAKKVAQPTAAPTAGAPRAAVNAPALQDSHSDVASVASAAQVDSPDALEQRARDARHAGDYGEAAALYRRAADMHRARGATGDLAAWDLAHAVECLAAAGQFDEAFRVRDQLSASYPSEQTAQAAAGRVLRTVEPPAAKSRRAVPPDPPPVQR